MPRVSDIEVLYRLEQPVLYISTKTNVNNLPNAIGESFVKLGAFLEDSVELLTDIPFVAFPGYENMDENNMSVVVGFPISRKLQGRGEIQSSVLPEGKIIFCMHRGDYGGMGPLYQDMADWIKENGYESAGTCYEYYYNGPNFPEEEMLTRVVIPLK